MLRLLLLVTLTAAAFAAEPKADPVFPSEIKLTSGAVLRNTSVVRWTTDSVVVKHAGGADPIRFVNIAEPHRSQVMAFRDVAKKTVEVKAAQKGSQNVRYNGQAFIATRGAGSYKISAIRIYVLPATAAAAFDSVMGTIELPDSLTSAVTDADGKFEFELPAGTEFLIFAQGKRLAGRSTELYEWRIPSTAISNPGRILLENANHRPTWTPVKVDGHQMGRGELPINVR